MSTTLLPTPTSLLCFGTARVDITPPVGIYHRMWGAARHDRATGVHRPLFAEVLVFAPLDGAGDPFARAQLDLVGLGRGQYEALALRIAAGAAVPPDRAVICFSHSHAAGHFLPDRMALPGGELIAPYLERLGHQLEEAARRALAALAPATINYTTGRCALAGNRDYRDAERGIYACGFNPDAPADDTVVVARATGRDDRLVATVVNYACHPTTLAWENTHLSPDYVGAMREVVEGATGAPCVFALGACGDLGPRDGYLGAPEVADRNGRQLGYAALAALESLPAPGTDFAYSGPVVSGATLGTWSARPLGDERRAAASRFAGGTDSVPLPLKPLPDRAALAAELAAWERSAAGAEERGETEAARDAAAHAERARRWLGRLTGVPPGPEFPLPVSVLRLGDAVWVTCAGEPYSALQTELRRRFPSVTLLVSPLAGGMQVAYLLPRDRYGLGLYQEEPSLLAPGCLELLTAALADRIAALVAE